MSRLLRCRLPGSEGLGLLQQPNNGVVVSITIATTAEGGEDVGSSMSKIKPTGYANPGL